MAGGNLGGWEQNRDSNVRDRMKTVNFMPLLPSFNSKKYAEHFNSEMEEGAKNAYVN